MCTYLGSVVSWGDVYVLGVFGELGDVYVLGVFGEMGGCVRTWGLW